MTHEDIQTPGIYEFNSQPVRALRDTNATLWFAAKDVCTILGYANPRDTVKKHCHASGITRKFAIKTNQGAQRLTFIDESNLYRLVFKSTKPEAETFQNWICEEVLPGTGDASLRKDRVLSETRNAPVIFDFNSHPIRTIHLENGSVWWVAKDVCDILGYANHRDTVKKLCRVAGIATSYVSDPLGRDQQTTCIDEGNLYRLILKSTKPEAEPFECWVCDEVLPQVRRTGSYTMAGHGADDSAADADYIRSLTPEDRAEIRESNLAYTREMLAETQKRVKTLERALLNATPWWGSIYYYAVRDLPPKDIALLIGQPVRRVRQELKKIEAMGITISSLRIEAELYKGILDRQREKIAAQRKALPPAAALPAVPALGGAA